MLRLPTVGEASKTLSHGPLVYIYIYAYEGLGITLGYCCISWEMT
jgi:hypothetical protein